MPSHPPAPDPLRQRMLATETSIRAAERCVRQLHLHHAAYLTRTVVADACRVIVEVEPSNGSLRLQRIVRRTGLHPPTIIESTELGLALRQAVVDCLESVLADCAPHDLWSPAGGEHEFTVPFPSQYEVRQVVTVPPLPPPGRVELVTYRQPRTGTQAAVFIDGQRVEHGELTAIDPERGDTLATWRDHAAQAAAAASSAAAPIIAGWYSDGEHFLPDHCLPEQARDGDRPCR